MAVGLAYPTKTHDLSFLDEGHKLLNDGKVLCAIHFLIDELWRLKTLVPPSSWAGFLDSKFHSHPIIKLLLRDPYTARAFAKPRGYAGDAVMLDYVYGITDPDIEPQDLVAKGVFTFTTNAEPARAVRYRREFIAHIIDQVAEASDRPIDVLALAAGHLREAAICDTIRQKRFRRCIAFDQDADSLQVMQSAYAEFGIKAIHGNVKDLLVKRLTFRGFDVVYAAGLFDYLPDKLAHRLMATMLAALRPGGLMLIPNFMPGIRESIYMEAFMKWFLIYRGEADLLGLLNEEMRSEIADISMRRDPFNNVIYMICRKAK